MTIYVDNAGIPATVTDTATGRNYTSRWCHLFSSEIDQTELHAFAARIGLQRAWFQPGKRSLQAHSTSTYTKPSRYGTPNEISCTNRKPRERGAMSTRSQY
jgi:hypothetical protein